MTKKNICIYTLVLVLTYSFFFDNPLRILLTGAAGLAVPFVLLYVLIKYVLITTIAFFVGP